MFLAAMRSHRRGTAVGLLALSVLLVSLSACDAGDRVPRPLALTLPSGDTLAYWVEGSGPDTVVVLHGGPAAHHGYLRPAFDGLKRDFTIVYYDMRGRGRSTFPRQPDAVTLVSDVDDLRVLLRHLKLSPPNLVAHHYGAYVAMQLLGQDSSAARRVVLLAPMFPRSAYSFALLSPDPPGDTKVVDLWFKARGDSLHQKRPREHCMEFPSFFFFPAFETEPAIIESLARTICDAPDSYLRRQERVFSSVMVPLGQEWDSTSTIHRMLAPVLVVQGGRNGSLGKSAREWAGRPRDGKLLILGQRSTLFPWLDEPAPFRNAVLEFLSAKRWPAAAMVTRRTTPDDSASGSGSR